MSGENLRSRYKAAVLELRVRATSMREAGASVEEVARAIHADRRRLTAHFKQQTPEPLRTLILVRTLTVYGDSVGPTIEHLRARGRSWDDIIDSATRTGQFPSFTSSAADR